MGDPINGHGHVVPSLDGARARCGGPSICKKCAIEKAQFDIDKKKLADDCFPADEINRLKAENERLKRMRERDNMDYYDEIKRLRVQLAEAVAALDYITHCEGVVACETARKALAKLKKFTKGQTTVEYALVVLVLVIVIWKIGMVLQRFLGF